MRIFDTALKKQVDVRQINDRFIEFSTGKYKGSIRTTRKGTLFNCTCPYGTLMSPTHFTLCSHVIKAIFEIIRVKLEGRGIAELKYRKLKQ